MATLPAQDPVSAARRSGTPRSPCRGPVPSRITRLALLAALLVAHQAPVPARSFAPCLGVAPVDTTSLESIPIAEGLGGFVTDIAAPPQDLDRLFLVVKRGLIFIRKRGERSAQPVTLFLDITDRVVSSSEELGLLSLAFDPAFDDNQAFYVAYTEADDPQLGPFRLVLSRFRIDPRNPDKADPASEERLLVLDEPQTNHNGCELVFGPDGDLYMSTGDGGGAGDRHGACGNAQDEASLLGKLLRLDVSLVPAPGSLPPDCGGALAGYRVPAGNPFVGAPGACDEIFALGLRNPWRFSIDPVTAEFYIADVGQDCWEELDWSDWVGAPGSNFGWRAMEGNHCYNHFDRHNCYGAAPETGCPKTCGDPSFRAPVYEYVHDGTACSIIGGNVYRGCLLPRFLGRYFFGDYCAGTVFSLRVTGGVAGDLIDHTADIERGTILDYRLLSFGTDAQGELYIGHRDGMALKILPPFTAMQVSGPGAQPFLLRGDVWRWEDLERTTMHPVDLYRVYRGVPNGTFRCIHQTPRTDWVGGDPTVPAAGELFAYLVTGVSPDGTETSPGDPAAARILLPDPCPRSPGKPPVRGTAAPCSEWGISRVKLATSASKRRPSSRSMEKLPCIAPREVGSRQPLLDSMLSPGSRRGVSPTTPGPRTSLTLPSPSVMIQWRVTSRAGSVPSFAIRTVSTKSYRFRRGSDRSAADRARTRTRIPPSPLPTGPPAILPRRPER